ncbi:MULTISPECIES: LysR family transcriptional regulator [Actinokineospora]|uniref:Transcriptional regulator n=1 Tax=Actinokineospora fastidiosa TaxID=1816 RepID=A0A918LEJ6_9PSEU|nr:MULTISPECIES: LysR family transcriptional regulator [Actinokineospora]GGS36366.1 transcriptional regulator [Actinokineospora fastidiosa]
MELEVRHLRALVTVADEGSITKAAAVLGLAQPSLTAQVQRIERAIGEKVFERGRTGVVTTSFGRGLLARARAVLREMDDLMVISTRSTRREIVLGDVGLLLSEIVPRLEEVFAADRGYTVRAHIDTAPDALVTMLRAGSLDAALISDVIGFESVEVHNLRMETVVPLEPAFVALWDRHPLADREAIDLADLAGESWIVNPHDNPGWLAALRSACRELGFEPRIGYQSTHNAGAREFVGTGKCVAIADPLSVENRGVVFRPLVGDPVRGRIDLAWTDQCPVPVQILRRVVVDAYRTMVDRIPAYRNWWSRRGMVPA